MDIETAIFAAVAVLLLARLWFVLGRKNDGDRERPNPFARLRPDDPRQDGPNKPASDEGDAVFSPRGNNADAKNPAPADPNASAMSVFKPLNIAPASLEGGLASIKAADASFDEKKFLSEARELFAAVIGAFAKGDLAAVEPRLGPKVLEMFRSAIAARREAGEMMENRIAKIAAETASARVDGHQGVIAVRFVSEQENVLRDKEGRAIGGEAGKLEEITDVWSFARDLKAPQNPWQLVATHG